MTWIWQMCLLLLFNREREREGGSEGGGGGGRGRERETETHSSGEPELRKQWWKLQEVIEAAGVLSLNDSISPPPNQVSSLSLACAGSWCPASLRAKIIKTNDNIPTNGECQQGNRNTKENYMETLELKNTVTNMKSSSERFKYRSEVSGGRISAFINI